MGDFKLLSARLECAVRRRKERYPDEPKITNRRLASAAGVSAPAVGYWFSDTNGIKAAEARQLAQFLDVNPVWLETGAGEPATKNEFGEGMGKDPSVFLHALRTDEMLRLVTAFRLADQTGRNALNAVVDTILQRLS